MAGYRLGQDSFINATTFNTQATRPDGQRDTTFQSNQSFLRRETLGVGRDTSNTFPGFDANAVLQSSVDSFLGEVAPSSNPDFVDSAGFDPKSMQTFDELTAGADANDKPFIGQGPNLKVQNLNDVILGNIDSNVDQIGTDLQGNSGFGWNDESHKNTSIGSYFKNKYAFGSQAADDVITGRVIKGERVDTGAVDYEG